MFGSQSAQGGKKKFLALTAVLALSATALVAVTGMANASAAPVAGCNNGKWFIDGVPAHYSTYTPGAVNTLEKCRADQMVGGKPPAPGGATATAALRRAITKDQQASMTPKPKTAKKGEKCTPGATGFDGTDELSCPKFATWVVKGHENDIVNKNGNVVQSKVDQRVLPATTSPAPVAAPPINKIAQAKPVDPNVVPVPTFDTPAPKQSSPVHGTVCSKQNDRRYSVDGLALICSGPDGNGKLHWLAS